MFKYSKKFLSLIMAILMLSMTAIGVNAEELITDTTDWLIDIGLINPSPEEELMPMAARGYHIPASVYGMYEYIMGGNDLDIYRHHEYENEEGYLPNDTTYETFYVNPRARLVIGANGSAYYFPDHYENGYTQLEV